MNIYFVFEGKTEPIVYRNWLKFLVPELTEVNNFDDVTVNNYHYESDMGVPDCYNIIANAIQEINEFPNYKYLVLLLDADRSSVTEKIEEAKKMIESKLQNKTHKTLPYSCELKIIVQKVCIETWFLGNRKFFVSKPQTQILKDYVEYYDTSMFDPELMASEFIQGDKGSKLLFGYSTKALFHEGYLREIFKEHNTNRTARDSAPSKHLSYKKSRPMEVQEHHFFEQILARIKADPNHLCTFQVFLSFVDDIRRMINSSQTSASLDASVTPD